jgi:TonB family protein
MTVHVSARPRWATLAMVLALPAGCASDLLEPPLPPPDGPAPINLADPVVTPEWTQRPTRAEADAALAPAARGVSGRAFLECRVAGERLAGCKVFSEFPGDKALGAAALSLAGRFTVGPTLPLLGFNSAFGQPNPLRYGEPAEGRRVRVTVVFGPAQGGPDQPPGESPVAPTQSAPPFSSPTTPLETVDWEIGPVANRLHRFYPERAIRLGLSGRALVSCVFDQKGRPTDCSVIESPAGESFGLSALRMVQYFRARPTNLLGQTVAGRVVHIPINFKPPA